MRKWYYYKPGMEAPNFRVNAETGGVHAGVWAPWLWGYGLFGLCFVAKGTHAGRHVITADAVTCDNCKKRLRRAHRSTAGHTTINKDLTALRLRLWGEFGVIVPRALRAQVPAMPVPESISIGGAIQAMQDLIAEAGIQDVTHLRKEMHEIALRIADSSSGSSAA